MSCVLTENPSQCHIADKRLETFNVLSVEVCVTVSRLTVSHGERSALLDLLS